MSNMMRLSAIRYIGDWNLGNMLGLPPDDEQHDYIRIDRDRALRDVSLNVLDNAYPSGGSKFDLCVKQANLSVDEFHSLVQMWGEPESIVFCFREPAGYMASAQKKWPYVPLARQCSYYIQSFENYEQLGGNIFEYSERITKQHYIDFLESAVPAADIEQFGPEVLFRGQYAPEMTTDEIWQAYHSFRTTYNDRIFPQPESVVEQR